MKIDILIKAGINVESAMGRFMGNMTFFEKMLRKFIDEPSFNEALKLYNNKEYDKMFEPLHALKGVSGNLDLKSLYDATCLLVDKLRVNDFSDIETLFSAVLKEYDRTIKGIKEALE